MSAIVKAKKKKSKGSHSSKHGQCSLAQVTTAGTYLEGLDDHGEGGRVKHDLAFLREVGEQLLDNGCKLWTEELVGFIHDKGCALAEVGDTLAGQVEDATGSSDDNMNGLAKTHDIVLEGSASGGDHHLDAHMFAEGLADLCCLEGELTGRDEEEGLDVVLFEVDLFERGDDEGSGLSGSVLCTGKNISSSEGNGYGFFLDRRWALEASLEDAHEQLALQEVVLKLVALGCRDVLERGKRQEEVGDDPKP